VNNSTTSCLAQVTVPLSAADQAAQTGAVTTFECDDAGDVTEQTQIVRAVTGTEQFAQTRTTTSEYDSLGRVTKVTTPLGGSTITLYDAAGRPVEVREYLGTGAGHDAEVTTTYVYDDAGHLLSEELPPVRDPVSGQMVSPSVSHVWDWLDDEVATTDERGKTWSYVYDALLRLIQTTSPLGLVARTEYRLVSATGSYQHQMTVWSPPGDPGIAGTVTTVTSYSVREWVDSVKVGSLTSTTYQYDPLGRQTRETAPSGVRTDLTYNGFDQVIQRRDFAQSATPRDHRLLLRRRRTAVRARRPEDRRG
jgi:large repetitive protein